MPQLAFGFQLGVDGGKFPLHAALDKPIGDVIVQICKDYGLPGPLSYSFKVLGASAKLDGTKSLAQAVTAGVLKNEDTLVLCKSEATGACSLTPHRVDAASARSGRRVSRAVVVRAQARGRMPGVHGIGRVGCLLW